MTNKNDDHEGNRDKLYVFTKTLSWANFIWAILEENKVSNIVDGSWVDSIIIAETRKKEKDNAFASKIIKQKVNDNLYIIIIRKKDPHQS